MDILVICQNVAKLWGKYWQLFLGQGLVVTLELSLTTVFFGAIVGSFIALMKMSRFRLLRGVSGVYIELFRGTPILLQLYLGYFIVPSYLTFLNGLDVDAKKFISICIVLILNSAAYVSEVIRAGIQAVDRGQTEAARSLGMTQGQTMLHIIIPQAVKNILPALGNEFVMMIKETSLASTFFLGDLMTVSNTVGGITYLRIEPLLITGAVYLVLTVPLGKVIQFFEGRLHAGD